MRVRLVIPGKTYLDEYMDKITAPGKEGSFQILPKHIDVVASLQPGILILTKDKKDRFFAINQGVLVKEDDLIHISCFQVIEGASLSKLQDTISKNFEILDEKEKRLKQILKKLEADTLIRFMETK